MMPDIVDRLLEVQGDAEDAREAADEIKRLRSERDECTAEIARLLIEVEEWKERCAAERRDHEATIEAIDKMLNEARP